MVEDPTINMDEVYPTVQYPMVHTAELCPEVTVTSIDPERAGKATLIDPRKAGNRGNTIKMVYELMLQVLKMPPMRKFCYNGIPMFIFPVQILEINTPANCISRKDPILLYLERGYRW